MGKVNDKKSNKAEEEINEKYVIFLGKRWHAHDNVIKQRSLQRLVYVLLMLELQFCRRKSSNLYKPQNV
jgi:hypothetical protein